MVIYLFYRDILSVGGRLYYVRKDKKYAIIKEWKLNEDTVGVSATRIAKTQWEGGFIFV